MKEFSESVNAELKQYIDLGYLMSFNEYSDEAWDENYGWHWTSYVICCVELGEKKANCYLFKSLDEVTTEDLQEIASEVAVWH